MFAKPFIRSRIRSVGPRRRNRSLVSLEILETRSLLAGTVPSGTYVEDFQLNSDPSERGWDVGGAFQERLTYISGTGGVNEVITDPNKVEGPEGTWSLSRVSGSTTDFSLNLQQAIYQVTF